MIITLTDSASRQTDIGPLGVGKVASWNHSVRTISVLSWQHFAASKIHNAFRVTEVISKRVSEF